MSLLSDTAVDLASYLAERLNNGLPAGNAAAVNSALEATMKVIDTADDTSFLDRSLTAVKNLEARLVILRNLNVFQRDDTYLERVQMLLEELISNSLKRKSGDLSGKSAYETMATFDWEPMCGPGLGPEDEEE